MKDDKAEGLPPYSKTLTEEEQEKTCARLRRRYDEAAQYYAADFKRIRLLDAVDKGKLWKALNARFPKYQILTDTNHVRYIKNHLTSSLYTVAKSAQVLPTSRDDVEAVENVNVLLDNIWDTVDVPKYEFQAGERAALCNLGITQVGWAKDMKIPGEITPENVALKNIDPMRFMRDPYAHSLEEAGWCCTWDSYDKSYFVENYPERMKKWEMGFGAGTDELTFPKHDERPLPNSRRRLNLVKFWVRETCEKDGKPAVILSEYHTVDGKFMMWHKRDVRPRMYPFAELYCNLPVDSLIGVSEPSAIFSNSVAYNLMRSLAFTAEYKNQRPPRFVTAQSGLNIDSFAKFGNDADRAFIVNGLAKDAVHYHQYPFPSSTLPSALDGLKYDIEDVSGVDGRYTGRDTGSIITTGGTEEMLDRVTLIDAYKIRNYESYAKRLTQLILLNLIEFSPKRTYLLKEPDTMGRPSWREVEINFSDLFKTKDAEHAVFRYAISISSELPKNKQRIAGFANMLMEKQMQYSRDGGTVDLITAEEWLQMQDLPNKEYMLKRMGLQRQMDEVTETAAIIEQFGELVNMGMDPEEAMARTAAASAGRRFGSPDAMPGASEDGQTVVTDGGMGGMGGGMGV
jgi:hypothetical protein